MDNADLYTRIPEYGSRTEYNRPAINGTTMQDRKTKSNIPATK